MKRGEREDRFKKGRDKVNKIIIFKFNTKLQ